MKKSAFITLLTSSPPAQAKTLARKLVSERLAACANVVSNVRSFYHWKGRLQHDPECLILFHTMAGLAKKLERRLKQIHPYEVPKVVFYPIIRGSRDFLSWLENETV